MRVRRVSRDRVYISVKDLVIAKSAVSYSNIKSGQRYHTVNLELVPELRLSLPGSFRSRLSIAHARASHLTGMNIALALEARKTLAIVVGNARWS